MNYKWRIEGLSYIINYIIHTYFYLLYPYIRATHNSFGKLKMSLIVAFLKINLLNFILLNVKQRHVIDINQNFKVIILFWDMFSHAENSIPHIFLHILFLNYYTLRLLPTVLLRWSHIFLNNGLLEQEKEICEIFHFITESILLFEYILSLTMFWLLMYWFC